MFLTLLFITRVAAEWVQISQHHYRKPLRAHTSYKPFTTPDSFEFEDTTNSWIFNNKTLTEHNLNKAPTRLPNAPNIKRMQLPKDIDKSTEASLLDENYSTSDRNKYKVSSESTVEFHEHVKQKGSIEKVPNKGNVQRVQLSNSPVKSPVANAQNDKEIKEENLAKSRYEELPLVNEDVKSKFFEIRKNTETKFNNRRIYINKIINQHSTESTTNVDESPEHEYVLKNTPIPELKNRSIVKNIFLPKPSFITENDDFIQFKENHDKLQKVKQTLITEEPEIKNKIQQAFTMEASKFGEEAIKQTKEILEIKSKNPTKATTKDQPLATTDVSIDSDDSKTRKNDNNAKPEVAFKTETESHNINTGKDKQSKDKSSKGNKTNDNLNNLLKIMKVVANTISQNSRRSFSGKINYLNDLKESILSNIAERIEAAWPDDEVGSAHRRSRSAQAAARGHHVHFPSSESALMTISFLTFAVFLIKLVLQVIQTYKNKAMMVAPVMVAAAGRSAVTTRRP